MNFRFWNDVGRTGYIMARNYCTCHIFRTDNNAPDIYGRIINRGGHNTNNTYNRKINRRANSNSNNTYSRRINR